MESGLPSMRFGPLLIGLFQGQDKSFDSVVFGCIGARCGHEVVGGQGSQCKMASTNRGLDIAIGHRVLPSQVAPALAKSFTNIRAHVVNVPSKREEMLGNFKLSVRGSIRKAPNVMPET